ncbi:MAG TPA: hypothetical protein VFJ99_03870 [Solirubrobacterales bacterium]|nr:hypothetical protein [Solirubrobacterales bacterium]
MRSTLVALACVLLPALVIGCGKGEEATPTACLGGSKAFEKALSAAPGEVKLEGGTPIGDCLTEAQSAGEIAQVGEAMVLAATHLNARARMAANGDAAIQLGYLIGAAERGSQDTEGIHADLVRRLTVAARYAPRGQPLPPSFTARYREGFDAGRADG